MQQHDPTQRQIGRHGLDRAHGMLPHIIAVMRIVLAQAKHRRQLGQNRSQDLPAGTQCAAGIPAGQYAIELCQHPLAGNPIQACELPTHGIGRLRLQGKAGLRLEAHAAEDAQRILRKPGVRIAHRPEHAAAQVGLPAKRVA